MEPGNSKTIQSSSIHIDLEIRIKDFRTACNSSKKGDCFEDSDGFFAWFSISAFPDGFDAKTKGWLVIRPCVTVLRGKYRPQNSVMSWTVSVIDVEGNSRFPRSFTQNLSKDITDAKYLERSFVLDRADDLLQEGVLAVRCDICFQWYNAAPDLAPANHHKIVESLIQDENRCDQELVKSNPVSEDSIDDFRGFVEKNKILTEVIYIAELGKVSAICDPPSSDGRHPKAWAFSTRTETFNLILDDGLVNIGSRLLKASAVIRKCVNSPMKERLEKRVELPDFDSHTFKIVVYFLTKGTLPKLDFCELMEIYKFSHMYEMEILHRNCSEDMVNSLDEESDFKELQKLADFYSDQYLSKLLCVSRHGDENLEKDSPHLRMDDKPYFDCYV